MPLYKKHREPLLKDLEDLYAKVYPSLIRYGRSFGLQMDQAEDLASQTFIKAIENLDNFKQECAMETWLFRIARNLMLDQQKKQKHFQPVSEDMLQTAVHPGPDPAGAFFAREKQQEILACVHGLPDPYKEVFLLRTYANLRFVQIGQLHGHTGNWACVTYHRAVQKIKAALEKGGEENG